jgi:hypothetical protein
VKTLYQSLIDYEMALLQGIAHRRAISLTTTNKLQAVELLAENLLTPAALAIILSDLSEAEKEALQLLLSHGGQIEAPRFAREYGFIRPIGSARLAREQPWRNPVNPAEGLWYYGLIFKTFQATTEGNLEIVYIPTDLLPLLEITAPTEDWRPETGETLKVSLVPIPAVVINGDGRLQENMFSLLVYLQTTPVRLESSPKSGEAIFSYLTAKDKKALASCLLPALPALPAEVELEFLLHLGQRAGLLTIGHGRLRLDRDPVRAWLQSQPVEQVRLLQNTWRADPTWNDLWHVPSLAPQPTGWENSPLLARSKILGYLAQVEAPAENWLSLDDFVAAIKRVEPDFQRPGGDYNSWYIYDRQGQPLMGFEHWAEVEGALIRYLLTHILLMLGIVEMGAAIATGDLASFRLTPSGQDFLRNEAPSPTPANKKAPLLRVEANFNAHVPTRASLYDRFQLARFATLERWEKERTVYLISQASVSRALKNGVTAEQITAFLARATDNQTPLKVIETILAWGARQNTARLEQATLLRLSHEGLLTELRQHSHLGPLLGEVLNSTTIRISADKVTEVRRLLIELGYLE